MRVLQGFGSDIVDYLQEILAYYFLVPMEKTCFVFFSDLLLYATMVFRQKRATCMVV